MKLPQNIVINYRQANRYGDEYHILEALIWDNAAGHPVNGYGTPIWGLELCGHIYGGGSGPKLIGWDRSRIYGSGVLEERELRGSLHVVSKVNRALVKAGASVQLDNSWRNGLLLMAFADALKARQIVIGTGNASDYRDMQWQSYDIKSGAAVVMGMIDHALQNEAA